MSRRNLFSICIAVIILGSVAYGTTWDNGAGTRDWNTPANWEPDGVPTNADTVSITNGLPEASEPIVFAGTYVNLGADQYNNSLYVSGGETANTDYLTIQGDVNTTQLIIVGDYFANNVGILTMDGGTMTAQTRGLWLGFQCTGILNMNSGTINLLNDGELRIGWTYDSGAGDGYLHLNGGVINCYDLWLGEIYPDNPVANVGYMDINGGTLVSGVDIVARIQGYINDGNNRIVAYSPTGIGPGIINPTSDPRASFQLDYDWRNAGRTTVTAYLAGNGEAYDLDPDPYAVKVYPKVTLTWKPGDYVAYGGLYKGTPNAQKGNGHHVFLHTSYITVNGANLNYPIGTASGHIVGAQDANSFSVAASYPGGTLKLDTTYYWCVIEANDANITPIQWTYKSLVQRFRTVGGKASNPNPGTGSEVGLYIGEPCNLLLSWTRGFYAANTNGHQVYFGTDYDEVNDADTLDTQYKITKTEPNWLATNLLLDKTYYWRVDEVNAAGPDPNWWKGDTWSFKVGKYRVVDAFDSDGSDDDLRARWKDAYLDGSACAVWGTGEELYSTTAGQNNTRGMRFEYDNNDTMCGEYPCWFSSFSEGRLEYASGKNWKYGDGNTTLKALALSYKGAAGNQVYPADPDLDKMYVAVESTNGKMAIVLNEDPNTQQDPAWQEWNIDLRDFNDADVNLASVKYLYIGFGVRCDPDFGMPGPPGGEGTVLFDNIRLYPKRCVGLLGYRMLGDLGGAAGGLGDCDVNMADVKVLVSNWLKFERISGTRQAVAGNDPCMMVRYEFEGNYNNDPNSRVGAAANGTPFGTPSIVVDTTRPQSLTGNQVLYTDQIGPVDYIQCGTWGQDGDFAGKSFTLMCWAKQTQVSVASAGWAYMIGKGEAAQKLEYGFTPIVRQVHFATHVVGTTSGRKLELGKWYHIAGTYQQLPNANGGYVRVYVEGRLEVSDATNNKPYNDINEMPYKYSHNPAYDPSWCIGAQDDEGDLTAVPPVLPGIRRPFHGYLDDVRVYDRRLTEEEIMYIAGYGPTQQNYYPMPEPDIYSNIYSQEAPGSKVINFKDLATLAQDWMRQNVLWPEN
jgi:hypothetical protein